MKAMLKKEFLEILRSYRWLLLPIVFVFLGLGQPISFKLMPQILKNASLPAGTVIQIPPPAPADVVSSILGQFNQLGVLMVILVVMGTVAQEKVSGVAEGVLVKPLGKGTFLTAKFIVYSFLTVAACLLGLSGGAYYTDILIGHVDWQQIAIGALVYLPYLVLVVAITILTSTLFSSQVAAGGTALLSVVAISLLPKLGAWSNKLFPGALTTQATSLFHAETLDPVWVPLAFVGFLIFALLAAAWLSLRTQEL